MGRMKRHDGTKWIDVAPSAQEFDAHQADDVSQGEVHGLRVQNEKLEFYTGAEWKIASGGVPVGNVANFSAEAGNAEVTLKWQDPENRYLDSEHLAIWAGTKIVRKTGSYPTSEDDGVLVVESKIRNQYATNGYKDTELTNEVEYYYMAFPYTEDNVATIDGANRVNAKPIAYDDSTGSPGNKILIGGTREAGYFGTVPVSEFITGNALASLVGITAGTSQNSNADWLKFAIDGKIIFSPMKPIRHSISWDQINAANAVFGGKKVTVQGMQFKVRLWKGANSDPASNYNGSAVRNSEWNKLMLPIHENAPSSWAYPDNVNSPTPDWGINLSDVGLATHSTYGNGSYTWCQETRGDSRVYRGGLGVSNSASNTASVSTYNYGWRPVLELI